MVQQKSSALNVRDFLAALIRTDVEMSDARIDELAAISALRNFSSKERFLTVGDKSSCFAVVVSGIFRAYYLTPDGTLLTRKFYRRGDFMGAFAAAITHQASHVTLEAIEPSEAITFDYPQFAALRDRNPEWEKVSRIALEKNYVLRETRAFQLLAFDATERYRQFTVEYADILPRLTKGDIASYLGISHVSLSRITNRKE